jgi:MFS transporter, PAT family, beta-lactamase induction signal transducer AmpG
VVLEAIGRQAAATKYTLLSSLSNMPIAYVTLIDGWASARWGANAMLWADAAAGALGLLVFAAAALGSRQRPAPALGAW